jgi:hypothetical protein
VTGISRRTKVRWLLRRAYRRARARLLAPVFRDRLAEPAHAVAVAGTARSGTTWLGGVLASGLRARVVFEPFHPVHVERAARFGLMPYRAPEDDDPALEAFCRAIFDGSLRGPWVDREASRLLPKGRVVKLVRANLLTGWLRRRFPEVPLILLVRHPAAVVLSRMEAGWGPDLDLDAMLSDERLVADHLAGLLDWARSLRTAEERHALVWAIHYGVALSQFEQGSGAIVVFYEDLVQDPERVLDEIHTRIGRHPVSMRPRALRRPSSTARVSGSAPGGASPHRWRRRLDEEQAGRILGVVERFDLDWLYGSGLAPAERARDRLHAAFRRGERAAESTSAAAGETPPAWRAGRIATAEE